MAKTEVATLAGGCFWCLEAAFPEQKAVTEKVIKELAAEHVWDDPIVTEVKPLEAFYPAEEYHRDYYRRNPSQGYCNAVIAPKVAKVRKLYFDKLKQPVS